MILTTRWVYCLLALCLTAATVLAAPQTGQSDAAAGSEEEAHFRQVLGESGSSARETMRGLEEHLRRYPDSGRRPTIVRTIVKAAIEVGDNAALLRYGEEALEYEPGNPLYMERLTRALLAGEDEASSKKALRMAKEYEAALNKFGLQMPDDRRQQAQMRFHLDEGLGKARVYQARALGNLGQLEEAAAMAKRAYETVPTAEAAREAGRWLERLERYEEAILHYAEAFAIDEPENTASRRAWVREKLRDLYLKDRDSEAGLGDLVLAAYDRAAARLDQRYAALRQIDPNFGADDPMAFTLTGLDGDQLEMKSLLGKVVVLDFWATWCGPCRIQHPLYDEVEQRFRSRDDVVFLYVNTDKERDVVRPFLEQNGWNKRVYFEDGLQSLLDVSSIPTTIILDKQGEIASRMNGFLPERFVEMLSERIEAALASD